MKVSSTQVKVSQLHVVFLVGSQWDRQVLEFLWSWTHPDVLHYMLSKTHKLQGLITLNFPKICTQGPVIVSITFQHTVQKLRDI